jgi:hypothetical protein
MAWTQDDLDTLKAAYASGTLRVRFSDGKEISYPSGADLLARIRTVEVELAAGITGERPPMSRVTTFRRD